MPEESLFSLELVVEKLYIPHITCRFPAIAFRLLDFPTILINHVEADLSKTIKAKICRDPYYELPNQFSELKDKHGNYMVKKGKSCLFKIPVETLKMHLTNTPLYVMVIDEYPETPKLIGNSTVPLNSLMDDICVDIARLGTSVPSVHEDKGLFKIYSLMGKEIGYFVLGFRLLCLGPGLIPHLPEAALTKRVVHQTEKEKKASEQVAHRATESHFEQVHAAHDVPRLSETCDMGSMTDVEKQDAILQTIEFNDKAVHVAISTVEEKQEKRKVMTASTQTTKRRKNIKQAVNEKQRFTEHVEDQDVDDGVIINNIVCPPPMFYNSDCDPKIKMQKMLHYEVGESEDDITIEDLEDVDLVYDNKMQKRQPSSRSNERSYQSEHLHEYHSPRQKAGYGKMQKNSPVDQVDSVFPVLTALLNELTGIQSSQFLNAVAQINQMKQTKVQGSIVQQKPPAPRPASKRLEELSQPRQPIQKFEHVKKDNTGLSKPSEDADRRSSRKCAQPSPGVPKNKGWLRQVPHQGVKKSSLTFGLTHTQRLRLANTNPGWLKAIEKEEADMKKKKELAKVAADSDAELNVTNLSDTLTEVRRLAQRELEKGEQTMDTSAGLSTVLSETSVRHDTRKAGIMGQKPSSPLRGKKWLSRYGKRSPSPKHRSKSPKCLKRSGQLQESMNNDKRGQSVRHDADDMKIRRTGSGETDETSQRSDQQSQKSIEVHLPSAQIDENEDDQSDMTLDDRDAIPEDNGDDGKKFPGFGKANESFPDSIDGQPNESLSETKNDDQPLESTRLSTNERLANMKESSDYDTRQFMSTDEPELQDLMSDEDDRSDEVHSGRHGRLSQAIVSTSIASSIHKFPVVNPVASEQSPVPATRRSAVKMELGRELTPETPRSQGSSKRPTPRPRRPTKLGRESVHTDSVSSYQPSDPDNALMSLSSDANYSDDFHPAGSEFDDSLTDISSPEILHPKLIPSTKLGYTIS